MIKTKMHLLILLFGISGFGYDLGVFHGTWKLTKGETTDSRIKCREEVKSMVNSPNPICEKVNVSFGPFSFCAINKGKIVTKEQHQQPGNDPFDIPGLTKSVLIRTELSAFDGKKLEGSLDEVTKIWGLIKDRSLTAHVSSSLVATDPNTVIQNYYFKDARSETTQKCEYTRTSNSP